MEDAKYGVIKEIVGQAEQQEHAAADKQEKIDPVTEEQIRKILGAVSYTHLDVYKRQDYMRSVPAVCLVKV